MVSEDYRDTAVRCRGARRTLPAHRVSSGSVGQDRGRRHRARAARPGTPFEDVHALP